MKSLVPALAILALAGCASAPKPLQGDFAPVAPVDASASSRVGDVVRWGGSIVTVTPSSTETCFEILGRDLGDRARPRRADDTSSGRFIACRSGFYDPAIFAAEREVTITGRIESFETRRIGEYDYNYPRVAAEVVYLWPERRPEDDYYYRADPFWPSHRPFWWGPGYYVPVRVHHHRHTRPPADAPAPAREK
jgi:outer membrane lipoprotein